MARPFIPVDNVAVFDILQELDGVPYCNSFHWWLFGDVWSAANLAIMAVALEGWFVTHMLPVLGDDVLYTGVRCRDLTSETGYTYDHVAVPVNGSYGFPSLPLSEAVYIKTTSSLYGPKHRFYSAISGIPKSVIDGNLVDPTYLLALWNAYLLWQDVFTWIDTVAVNVSYITNNTYRPNGVFYGVGRIWQPKRTIGTRARRLRNWIGP